MQRNLLEEIQSLESMTKEGLVAGRCRLEAETTRGKALSISSSRNLFFSIQRSVFLSSDQQSSLSWNKFMLQSKESSRRSGEQESRGVEFSRLTFYLSESWSKRSDSNENRMGEMSGRAERSCRSFRLDWLLRSKSSNSLQCSTSLPNRGARTRAYIDSITQSTKARALVVQKSRPDESRRPE